MRVATFQNGSFPAPLVFILFLALNSKWVDVLSVYLTLIFLTRVWEASHSLCLCWCVASAFQARCFRCGELQAYVHSSYLINWYTSDKPKMTLFFFFFLISVPLSLCTFLPHPPPPPFVSVLVVMNLITSTTGMISTAGMYHPHHVTILLLIMFFTFDCVVSGNPKKTLSYCQSLSWLLIVPGLWLGDVCSGEGFCDCSAGSHRKSLLTFPH